MGPVVRTALPEDADTDEPDENARLPLALTELAPLYKLSPTLEPEEADPVERMADPLEPKPITSLEDSCREPDPADDPDPVLTVTLPPEPLALELEPPEITTEPPSPESEGPTRTEMLPALPPVE